MVTPIPTLPDGVAKILPNPSIFQPVVRDGSADEAMVIFFELSAERVIPEPATKEKVSELEEAVRVVPPIMIFLKILFPKMLLLTA